MTRICIPLAPRSSGECCTKMAALAQRCDLFEIRADAFESAPDLPLILGQASRPVLWTHRSPSEGGHDNPRQRQRLEEYRQALLQGARWADVEWKSGLAPLLETFADRLVLSLHDFGGTPREILRSVREMARVPCGVIKVAAQVNRTEDLEALAACACWLKQQEKKFVIAGMGEDGKPLRVLAPRLGSEWTYAALDQATASGQLTEDDLELYRLRDLSARSTIYAVIGNPVAHSQSPGLHNSAYRLMDRDAVYAAIRVDDLDAYLRLASTLGIAGWSVTLPWKEEMARRSVLQDAASRASGVVNTVRREDTRYLGWNTDWYGFLEPLRRRRPLAGLRACIVGTGGAARTAVAALLLEQARVVVLGRRSEALAAFAAEFPVKTASLADAAEVSGDLIVNATPVGMWPAAEAMPVSPALLSRFEVAYDLIYTPRQTMFLRAACRLGLQAVSGWEMFVLQAVEQIGIFTGSKPPAEWVQMQLAAKDPEP